LGPLYRSFLSLSRGSLPPGLALLQLSSAYDACLLWEACFCARAFCSFGSFATDYYQKRKEKGIELPGYIEDFPAFVDKLLASDDLPERSRQLILAMKKNVRPQSPKNHLLLTADDLAAQVKKHTNLSIKSEEQVVRDINNTSVQYIGMILEKN
jgi:hypothetical protein